MRRTFLLIAAVGVLGTVVGTALAGVEATPTRTRGRHLRRPCRSLDDRQDHAGPPGPSLETSLQEAIRHLEATMSEMNARGMVDQAESLATVVAGLRWQRDDVVRATR